MYDIFKLNRSETLIKRKCKKIGKSLMATTDISVIVPVSAEAANLLVIDERVYSVGSLMYTDGKDYAVLNIAATIELGRVDHHKTMVRGFDGEETECYEFKYEKGDRIHPTNEVPINAQLSYPYTNHHIMMAKTIPFFDVPDIESMLDSIPRFCQFGLPEYGYTNHYLEMILRSTEDLQVPQRLTKSKKFSVIPFSSVVLNVSSNIGKNRGGYLEDGMMSASVTTSESSTSFEKIMRA